MARNENMIAALKRERAVYVNAGDQDRVDQVDESLAHYGYSPEPSEDDGPQGRTEAPQQTADQSSAPARKTAAKKTAASKPLTVAPTTEQAAPPPAE